MQSKFPVTVQLRVGVCAAAALLLFWCGTGAAGTKVQPPPRVSLIRTTTNLLTNYVSEYKYDSAGNILQVSSKGGTVSYQYLNGSIIKTSVIYGKKFSDTLWLNAKGLVEEDHDHIMHDFFYRYEYTSYGQCKAMRAYLRTYQERDHITTDTYTILNGNVVMRKGMEGERLRRVDSMNATFYPNRNTIGSENMGMAFRGKDNYNLTRTSDWIAFSEEKPTCVVFNYHYDAKSRVTIKVSYGRTGNLLDSTGYSYY